MQALEPFGIPLYYDPSKSIPNVYLLTPFCVFFNGSRDILPLMCLCPSQHFFPFHCFLKLLQIMSLITTLF